MSTFLAAADRETRKYKILVRETDKSAASMFRELVALWRHCRPCARVEHVVVLCPASSCPIFCEILAI